MKYYHLLISFTILVTLKTQAQVDFTYSGKTCVGNTIEFTNMSDELTIDLEWDFNDGSGSTNINQSHIFTTPGVFKITLSGTYNSNKVSKTKDITIHQNPTANFTDSTLFFSSFTHIFTSNTELQNNITNYNWNFGDGTTYQSDTLVASYKYKSSGNYTVKLIVTDNNNCTDSTEKNITVEDIFIVPNVFTPNNDLINDLFIVTTNGITNFSIDIFSRWGMLVFSRSGHQQIVWDGCMPNGKLVNPGTYYYIIKPIGSNQIYEPQKGFITVFH